MKPSTRFSDAIHILAFIQVYRNKATLSSETIAQSIGTSSVVVRRLMGKLKTAHILTTTPGSPDPKLAVDPQKLTLLQIYLIIEGNSQLFTIDPKTNPACIVGGNIQTVLRHCYQTAEEAAMAKLNQTTLQDIINAILVHQAQREVDKK